MGLGVEERVRELASRMRGYDPVEVSLRLERLVERGDRRRYFRFRGSRFYGGSAVGDVVLCNLRCAFCWTGRPRDDPRLGFYVSPREAAEKLLSIARREGYRVLRLSAGEPTLGRRHLLRLLSELSRRMKPPELFVLETNGLMLAIDETLVEGLEEYRGIVHVRLSVKACSPEWFKVLTGASEKGLELQLRAIELLEDHGLSYHVSVFAAFGSEECWSRLLEQLASRVGPKVLETIEVEPLVLYPTAQRRLRILERLGVKPRPALVYKPTRQ